MALGRKHNKQGMKVPNDFVCDMCKLSSCENCIDVLRAVYTDDTICKCKRKDHSGEPVNQQVRDPFDGSVHAPNAVISEDGQVTYNEEFRSWWRKQFGTEAPDKE